VEDYTCTNCGKTNTHIELYEKSKTSVNSCACGQQFELPLSPDRMKMKKIENKIWLKVSKLLGKLSAKRKESLKKK
jgi:hypothetical protein